MAESQEKLASASLKLQNLQESMPPITQRLSDSLALLATVRAALSLQPLLTQQLTAAITGIESARVELEAHLIVETSLLSTARGELADAETLLAGQMSALHAAGAILSRGPRLLYRDRDKSWVYE